jgi:hypothetical protein
VALNCWKILSFVFQIKEKFSIFIYFLSEIVEPRCIEEFLNVISFEISIVRLEQSFAKIFSQGFNSVHFQAATFFHTSYVILKTDQKAHKFLFLIHKIIN